jgi:alpha/beta superfamily hydrolase
LLESEMNVLLFDCAGSGVSEGEYVSLGVRESEDLEAVVAYLAERRQANNICLWGRSMGAVTALLYASRNKKQIKCCVYDSPFRSLKKLIK